MKTALRSPALDVASNHSDFFSDIYQKRAFKDFGNAELTEELLQKRGEFSGGYNSDIFLYFYAV